MEEGRTLSNTADPVRTNPPGTASFSLLTPDAGALRLLAVLALACVALIAPDAAHANRFGPPWQSEVTAEQTIVYSEPDRGSAPVGPLSRGAIVMVTGEASGEFTSTHIGYIPSADLVERDGPWTAEVTAESVSVYAKPNAGSGVRMTASEGDLLRVTGASPGLEGDTHLWWATTEGYVQLGTIAQADTSQQYVGDWTVPDRAEATNGWWGQVVSPANVRTSPTTEAPIVGEFGGGEQVKVLAEEQGQDVQGSATWYRIDGGRYAGARVHSSLIERINDPAPNTSPLPSGVSAERWIVVDRAARTLTLMEGGQPRFVTFVAIGDAGRESPAGLHNTFLKFRVDDMTSTSIQVQSDYYDLPNVPYTQYYRAGGFAIHGTYWHDQFGATESHGCINLTWTDSAYLFPLTQPAVPDGQVSAESAASQATPVLVVN